MEGPAQGWSGAGSGVVVQDEGRCMEGPAHAWAGLGWDTCDDHLQNLELRKEDCVQISR